MHVVIAKEPKDLFQGVSTATATYMIHRHKSSDNLSQPGITQPGITQHLTAI